MNIVYHYAYSACGGMAVILMSIIGTRVDTDVAHTILIQVEIALFYNSTPDIEQLLNNELVETTFLWILLSSLV